MKRMRRSGGPLNGMALNGMAHSLAAMNGMGTPMTAIRPPAPKAAPRRLGRSKVVIVYLMMASTWRTVEIQELVHASRPE